MTRLLQEIRVLAVVTLFVLVGVACNPATVAGPPEINYGRDICIQCGMIIDDPRFAAGYRIDDGTEKAFDDLGGLIIHGRATGELADAVVWVSDFEHEVLIEADGAFYVPTAGVNSPMGHGILAFSEKSRADQVAADLGGAVIGWDRVIALPVVDGLIGDHHGDE
jgi:copper chaperone NosL